MELSFPILNEIEITLKNFWVRKEKNKKPIKS